MIGGDIKAQLIVPNTECRYYPSNSPSEHSGGEFFSSYFTLIVIISETTGGS